MLSPQIAVSGNWRREMTGRHWWILAVAALAWSFDTMDQRIFILARAPAVASLLPAGTSAAQITYYSGISTAIFMLGWAIGGLYFGVMGDRYGRARTMMVTVLLYSAFTGLSALSRGFWGFFPVSLSHRVGSGRRICGGCHAGRRIDARFGSRTRSRIATVLRRDRKCDRIAIEPRDIASRLALDVRRGSAACFACGRSVRQGRGAGSLAAGPGGSSRSKRDVQFVLESALAAQHGRRLSDGDRGRRGTMGRRLMDAGIDS